MIELSGVTFRYKKEPRYALQSASCKIESSGITAIVGRSGIGKSTLLALVAGIFLKGDPAVEEFSGHIDVDGIRPCELRGTHMVSWVPQTAILLNHLNVTENVILPLRINKHSEKNHKEPEALCLDLLQNLEILDKRFDRPSQLSGGMKTRVSLARALITKPKYLFLDEPFASLDVGVRWNIYKAIAKERRALDFCTLLSTHNVPEAVLLADRVLVVTQSESKTLLTEINNPRIALTERVDRCLGEARSRAQRIEAGIFSAEIVD